MTVHPTTDRRLMVDGQTRGSTWKIRCILKERRVTSASSCVGSIGSALGGAREEKKRR